MPPERDPHEEFPDAPDVDVERLVRLAVRAGINYQESPKSYAWQKTITTICGGVAMAGILGGVAMYGKLSAIEASQVAQARDISRLQAQMDVLVQRKP